MKSKRETLVAEIRAFLAAHAKRDANDPEFYNSPDAHQLENAALQIEAGVLVTLPHSDWGSGGYKPFSDRGAQAVHDRLLRRIKEVSSG